MNLTTKTLIKIENYLNGNMTSIEKETFKVEINQSEEIKEFIEIYQQINQFENDDDWITFDGETSHLKKAIQLFQQKDVQNFSEKLKIIRKEQKPEKKLWQWKKVLYANGLVACLLVFIYVFYFQQPNLNRIYNNNNSWNELPSLSVKGTNLNDQLNKLEKLFNENKFDESRKLCLTIIGNSKTLQPNILLYLGVSQLELNEYDNALKTFTTLTKSNTLDFHKGYWYKAMIYLKKEEKELLINELNQIKKHHYYNNDKAVKILKKLKAN